MGVVVFYICTIGFALGIFFRSIVSVGLPEIAGILLCAFCVALIWRRVRNRSSAPQVLWVSLFLFLFALGALRLEWASWSEINPVFESKLGEEVVLTGIIMREPDARESSTHLYINVTADQETILVFADAFGTYTYGDVVEISGVLQKPTSFETDLGRTFNYPGYLQARDVSYTLAYADVQVIDHDAGHPVIGGLLSLKHSFMDTIEGLIPEPHVGLSEGLLLGVKRALGEDLEETFRETGIIHIVVLSGYNVMLVVIFVTFLLGVFIPRRFQLPFGLAAIASFAFMVGLSATVVRASVMASMYLIARSLNRTYMVVRALMLAGVIMLLLNPYLLAFDTGFQLSFVATLGLILVGPHIEARLTRLPNQYIKMREFLTATLATQLFVMPILLYQIGEFSVVSVLVNVLVLPMVPVAMFLTFLTGVVGAIAAPVAVPFAYLTYVSLEYILVVATWFGELPFASYVVPAFSFVWVPVAYGVLGYVLYRMSSRTQSLEEASMNLTEWTIEEAEVVRARLQRTAQHDEHEVPVFFR